MVVITRVEWTCLRDVLPDRQLSVGLGSVQGTESVLDCRQQAGAFLEAYLADEKAERPRSGMAPASLMRFCADDIKAFYLEAAGSGEGTPSSRQMTDWFWNETVAGRVIKDIYRGSADSADKQRQALGVKSIVPGIYQG